ncbi:MAG: HEAT repeat domain-containing protein [Planctomycetota bacterium]
MSRSPRVLPSVLVLSLLSLALSPFPAASAQDADQLWADFAHYVRIASPELAGEAAAALSSANPGDLLDAVEASDYNDPNRIFQRAAGMEAIAEVAAEVQAMIQIARLERSREPERIAQDITTLSQGQRAYNNATARLKAAGQFAAPQMLAALVDKDRGSEHPAIMRSMIDIGRPLVAPLSIALPELNPVPQGQIAQVLGTIGYPQAMPALKQVIEDPDTDPTARAIAQNALADIAANSRTTSGASAADLYLALGQGAYKTATTKPAALDTYDQDTNTGVVWNYDRKLTVNGGPGLVPVVVPGTIIGDVTAMQSAETALSLNPDLDAALSLFITANLRRENRLPEGEVDRSYSSDRQEPSYYAMVAGPQRLHDVLATALDAQDAALALDAIAALSATASLDALQPLVRGLGYPDRRVRFRSAEALAKAMPEESFTNDFRVVPVLGDAVRQGDSRVALVVAASQDDRNELLAAIASEGFQTIDGESVRAASGLVAVTPGVDLILVTGNLDEINQALVDSQGNYKLASSPIVAMAATEDQARLSGQFQDDQRVSVILEGADTLSAAVQQLTSSYSGSTLSSQESQEFALSALALLREIAVSETTYEVTDALPALIEAVQDPRPAVAIAAGDTLSRIDDPEAQAAIAADAISRTGEVQVAHLIDLAESANAHGNLISAQMSDDILMLVKTAEESALADAAAKAHGALGLPTRNAVDLILGE